MVNTVSRDLIGDEFSADWSDFEEGWLGRVGEVVNREGVAEEFGFDVADEKQRFGLASEFSGEAEGLAGIVDGNGEQIWSGVDVAELIPVGFGLGVMQVAGGVRPRVWVYHVVGLLEELAIEVNGGFATETEVKVRPVVSGCSSIDGSVEPESVAIATGWRSEGRSGVGEVLGGAIVDGSRGLREGRAIIGAGLEGGSAKIGGDLAVPEWVEVGVGEGRVDIGTAGIANLEVVPVCVLTGEDGLDFISRNGEGRGVTKSIHEILFPVLQVWFQERVGSIETMVGVGVGRLMSEVVVPGGRAGLKDLWFDTESRGADFDDGFLRDRRRPAEVNTIALNIFGERGDGGDSGFTRDFDFYSKIFRLVICPTRYNREKVGSEAEKTFN